MTPKPGRELDIQVAEHVMGLGVLAAIEREESHPKGGWVPIRNYSTNIASAWRVVEKLGQYRLELFGPYDEDPTWVAKFRQFGYRSFQDMAWDGCANTAPHAICLAALAIMGEK